MSTFILVLFSRVSGDHAAAVVVCFYHQIVTCVYILSFFHPPFAVEQKRTRAGGTGSFANK